MCLPSISLAWDFWSPNHKPLAQSLFFFFFFFISKTNQLHEFLSLVDVVIDTIWSPSVPLKAPIFHADFTYQKKKKLCLKVIPTTRRSHLLDWAAAWKTKSTPKTKRVERRKACQSQQKGYREEEEEEQAKGYTFSASKLGQNSYAPMNADVFKHPKKTKFPIFCNLQGVHAQVGPPHPFIVPHLLWSNFPKQELVLKQKCSSSPPKWWIYYCVQCMEYLQEL